MKNEEIAKRLREILRQGNHNAEIARLADELDPPHPDPGTVVWFPLDEECGVVAENGKGVYTSEGEFVEWKDLQEGTKRVRVLAPDEVAISIGTARAIISEGPQYNRQLRPCFAVEARATLEKAITRAEAERMEAWNGHTNTD